LSIPGPPYGDEAIAYMKAALDIYPNLKIAVVWTDPATERFVRLPLVTLDPRRVLLVNGKTL